MTMTKHTQGPWTVKKTYFHSPESSETYAVIGPKGEWLHSAGGDAGTMRTPDTYSGYNFTEANARLIAAAPDLLASLEEVLAYCVEHGHDWMCMVDARSAIAKATGETV
jgi:hypothetical protein